MEFPHLERLSRAECRQLLPSAPVGRLAVPTPHFPTLELVSFAVVEGELVVAVPAGSAGDALAADTVVTFEAGVSDQTRRQGWSVTVSGAIEELDADVAVLVRSQLKPWPVAETDRLLLVRSDRISGQRVVTAPAAESETASELIVSAAPDPNSRLIRKRLTTDQALAVLGGGGQQVGRLVVSLADGPGIFPLNFALDGDAVVFRTQVGTKLAAIARSLVTFEIDTIDSEGQGWAVVVQGLAQEVLDADPASLRDRMSVTAVDTWPGGERLHVVRITPYRVDGTSCSWTVRATTPLAASEQSA